MNKRNLQPKRALRSVLLVLLLCVVGVTNAIAATNLPRNYDFTSVVANGQTLYYKITNSTNHTVMVTHPNGNENTYTYNDTDRLYYYNNPYLKAFTRTANSSGYTYTYDYYEKPSGNLIIPYYVEHNGISYSVTAIDEYAFGTIYLSSYACTGLTSVVIPASVQIIGKQAFASCTGLTTVTIPTSVTSIGEEAFRYCNKLVTVNFNATNWTIAGDGTSSSSYSPNIWTGCSRLTTINFGNTVTRIPNYGFKGAPALASIILPNHVTSIGNYAFQNCTNLSNVTLSGSVEAIGTYVFSDCTNLTNVTINAPSNLVSISSYAFYNCTNLTNVTINEPNNLASISERAFYNCSKLATINLPNSLTSIGTCAFYGCSLLRSTMASQLLPNALQSIGAYAFQNATTLAYIRIPSTLTSLGIYAFQGCTALNRVDYEATNCVTSGTEAKPPFFSCPALATVTVSGNVTQIPAYCFKDCTALTNLTLRNGLTEVGTYGFYDCRNINSLVLPVSLTNIGSFAFGNAYDMQLARVESHNATPPTLGEQESLPSGQTIYVPNASVAAYQNDANWGNYNIVGMDQHYDFSQACTTGQTLYYLIEDETMHTVKVTYAKHYNSYYYQGHPEPAGAVVIPSSVTYNGQTYTVFAIDEYAFKDCVNMTAITIPATISSIAESAFANCTGLNTVTYNANNCTTMGTSDSPVFAGCTALTTLNIGTGVTVIPAYAFKNCTHLNCNLVFPNTLLSIGEEAFYGCSAMISQLIFPNAVTTIGDRAFYHCSSLIGNLRLGTSVTSVGVSAFEDCSGLTTLTMYEALQQIGASAFKGCSGIAGTVTIPNGVGQIANAAFKDCIGINNLVIGNNVTILGNEAFKGCTGITNLVIGNGVTTLGNEVFKGCTSLAALTLGTAIESIGNNAFENCSTLAVAIELPSSVTTVGENAFTASGLTGITIPSSVTSIGVSSFKNCTGLIQINLQNNTIAESQFEGCTALTTLTIPATITTMGDNAFKNCTSLSSLMLQNETIGVSAFEGCTGLAVLNISDGITTIGNKAFYDCSGLTALSVPYTVTSIGTSVFENCTALTNVTLNNPIIGANQFKGCTSLTTFMVPTQIISIGENAFLNCDNLTVFTYNAENCTMMGSSETPIFGGSTAITEFYIGPNVNTIANYAFKNCGSVTEIHAAPANAPQFTGYDTQYAFADIQQNIPVYVPCDRASYYQNATYWNHFSNYIEAYPYSVSVATNNEAMGNATVTQAPSCANNGQTIVTATPNQDYFFVNWTLDGNTVSTNPTYSFTPTENELLMANFADSQITINVNADPEEGGTVTGGGDFDYGTNVTLTAVANTNYTFVNWTENGNVVSNNSIYTFTANVDRNLIAHFTGVTNYWEPETDDFEDNMTLTCIVQLDGVEQATTMLEVGAFCGTQCRGSQRATYFAPTNRYIIQMTVFGENNDVISFRLYDHQQNQELLLTQPAPITFTTNGYGSLFNPYVLNFTSTVTISAETNPAGAGTITGPGDYAIGTEVTLIANANTGYQFVNWTLNGVVVSTSASYQFMVTDAAHFVANFGYVHTQALNSGWNWWSSYIELANNNGLSQLENSVGSAGIIIKSRANGYVEAYQYNGETNWYGTLSSINNEQMYKIRTNAACNATIAGMATMPSSHPISIKNGWNWIGFPCNQNVSVDVAMSGFTPENNDVLKGRNGFTTYYSDDNYSMWYGTLNTLEPGKGYMYRSNSATQKTLVFQTGRGEATTENVTTENNYFQPADGDFADNMTITAVLELDGEELRSEDYELAAFVGDECRGSVKLLYVEPVNRYVAFLIVFGEPSESLHFRITDGRQTKLSVDEVTFVADGMVGTLAEPITLRFGMTQVDENELPNVMVYPNPSQGVFNIQGQDIRKVEVFNAFGQVVVSEETSNDNVQVDLSRYANGYYMLRVITDNGIQNSQLIKK